MSQSQLPPLPPICFGTAPLSGMPGTYGFDVDEAQARETLRAVFASTCPFVDTSRNYGAGRAEARIGAYLREAGGLPTGAMISTKLDRDMETNRFDGAQARRSVEQSLETLGVDSVALLHLHDPEYAADIADVTRTGGALDALAAMKTEGLCRRIGLAAGRVDVMLPILRDFEFDVMITHSRFTLVNRNAEAMIDFARERGIEVLNAAPYASGVLAKGSANYPRYVYQAATEETLAPVRDVEAVCSGYGVELGAAALQFSTSDPRIASTIVGVSDSAHVAQTLTWLESPVSAAARDALAALPATRDDPEASRVYTPG